MTGPRPRGVDVVYFDGGGAHRSAALALRDALVAIDPGIDVRMTNATSEVMRHTSVLRWIYEGGIAAYNGTLKTDTMFLGDLETMMRAGAWAARTFRPAAMPGVRQYYRQGAPGVVVSFVPMHNRLLFDALRAERPGAACMVVPVDFQELFDGYWFDPDLDADYLCGTERLAEHARAAGVSPDHVVRIDGMPTHPRFHAPRPADVSSSLIELGLDPARRTVLVFFGAQGSRTMVDVAHHLDAGPTRVNLLVVCGHHASVARELAAWTSRSPKHVVGFTREIPALMRVADVLVGKPGPVSIYEALASRLPMVLWDNPSFSLLFDYNLAWVEEQGVGLRIRSVPEVVDAVRRVLGAASFRESTARFIGDATAQIARAVTKALERLPAQ